MNHYLIEVRLSPDRDAFLGGVLPRIGAPTQVISFMMCKGGVGKTTSSFMLAKRLSQSGHRVLVIDADPQGNLTTCLNPVAHNLMISEKTPVLADVISRNCHIQNAIQKLTSHLHLIPSTAINSLLDRKLEVFSQPIFEVKNILAQLAGKYQYIIIDTAPALNLINSAIIYASSTVILPITMDEFSRQGMNQTLDEIEALQEAFHFQNNIRILVNMYQEDKLSLLYLGLLSERAHEMALQTTIRYSPQIKHSISSNQDLFQDELSHPKEDYESLAKEIVQLTQYKGGHFANS